MRDYMYRWYVRNQEEMDKCVDALYKLGFRWQVGTNKYITVDDEDWVDHYVFLYINEDGNILYDCEFHPDDECDEVYQTFIWKRIPYEVTGNCIARDKTVGNPEPLKVRTRLDEFHTVFPNANMDKFNSGMCPHWLDPTYTEPNCDEVACDECMKRFWNELRG